MTFSVRRDDFPLRKVKMIEEEKYVSRQGVSRDLLHVVTKFGLANLRQYIQSARNPVELRDILLQAVEWLKDGTFQVVSDYNQSPKMRNIPGCQSFERAWKQLKIVSTMPTQKIKNRYQLLLDSVTFVEADIMRRLISGNFDVENVKIYYGVSDFAAESPTENKSQKGQPEVETQLHPEVAPPEPVVESESVVENEMTEEVVVEKPKKRGRKKKVDKIDK